MAKKTAWVTPESERIVAKRVPSLHNLRREMTPLWFMLPALLVLGSFIGYPLVYSLSLSLRKYQVNTPSLDMPFVGLENYFNVLQDERLLESLRWTVAFAAVSVPIELAIGLVLALLLDSTVFGRARAILRAIALSPMMLSPIVAGFAWRLVFDPGYGPVNHVLSLMGFSRVGWFTETLSARTAVIVADVWLATPFVALVLLAGLQGIPEELYEACRIDGASALQSFVHITLPFLRRAVMVVLAIRTMDALRAFSLMYILTKGGPGTATTTAIYQNYRYAFLYHQLDRASAVSLIAVVIMCLITSGYMMSIRRGEPG